MENELELGRKYWEREIREYMYCACEDMEDIDDTIMESVIGCVMGDDEMWQKIDETIEYYLHRIINNK